MTTATLSVELGHERESTASASVAARRALPSRTRRPSAASRGSYGTCGRRDRFEHGDRLSVVHERDREHRTVAGDRALHRMAAAQRVAGDGRVVGRVDRAHVRRHDRHLTGRSGDAHARDVGEQHIGESGRDERRRPFEAGLVREQVFVEAQRTVAREHVDDRERDLLRVARQPVEAARGGGSARARRRRSNAESATVRPRSSSAAVRRERDAEQRDRDEHDHDRDLELPAADRRAASGAGRLGYRRCAPRERSLSRAS